MHILRKFCAYFAHILCTTFCAHFAHILCTFCTHFTNMAHAFNSVSFHQNLNPELPNSEVFPLEMTNFLVSDRSKRSPSSTSYFLLKQPLRLRQPTLCFKITVSFFDGRPIIVLYMLAKGAESKNVN